MALAPKETKTGNPNMSKLKTSENHGDVDTANTAERIASPKKERNPNGAMYA